MLLWYPLLAVALAQTETLHNIAHQRQVCAGVYSADDIAGAFESMVEVSFGDDSGDNSALTLAIFAYSDLDSLGIVVNTPDGSTSRKYLCDQEAVQQQMCSADDIGTIIVDKYTTPPKHEVYSHKITLPTDPIKYAVNETGYYCVVSFPLEGTSEKYTANVHFMNAYGHVPGEEYPLMLFHAIMTLIYLVFFIGWSVMFFKYRQDALAVQKWITGLAAYMTIEQVVLWVYYNYFNGYGQESGVTKFLLFLVAILSAGRLSLTLFCVLIVAMGYSVVHERLGPKMRWCKILGAALFVTSALYMLDSYYLVPSDESRVVEFLFFLPSAVMVGIFYVWTLQSLGDTKQSLLARKQYVKARMYRNLWAVLLGSAIAIFAFFSLHTVITATQSIKDVVNNYWKTKWLLSNGWPNIVYMLAFMLVAMIWRPTGDNRRFAMSTQLAQNEDDAEEFEIGSLDGSDVEPEQEEEPEPVSGIHRTGTPQQPRSETIFDTESIARHDDDSDDVPSDDQWNRNEDEDDLVSAPGGQIKPSR